MKHLAIPSFFRFFDLLLAITNPALKLSRWSCESVEFTRERYNFTSSEHGFSCDIFKMTHAGRHGWRLMVVKEHWWIGEDAKIAKTTRWARPIRGKRSGMMAWLRSQEAALDRSSGRQTDK